MKRWWLISLMMGAVILSLQGCGERSARDRHIVSNEFYSMTGDSLVMGDTIVYSTDGKTIKTNLTDDHGNEMMISFASNPRNTAGVVTTDYKLIDALSSMSIAIVTNRNNMHFDTSNDLYDAIGLTLAYVDPELSMNLLKEKVKDGVIEGNDNKFYPAFNNRLSWASAAWRVYLITGNKEWLKYAYKVAVATFEQEQEIAYYKRDWLVRGCSSDYTPLVESLPEWMENNDVFSTFTLSNNTEIAQALSCMAEMASELGQDNTRYANLARDLVAAVNENLWNENHGQYTALIYGQSCTLHAPCSDNRAQALAVLWGLADEDDRSTTLIEKTTITHNGINNIYPARNHTTEPCLNEMSWGLTQGLWNLAAAHVDNDNALRRGLAALYRAQALYSTLFVNAGSANLDITAAISNVAMTHRLMAGLKFDAEGIEFAPVIPEFFSGDKHLDGFMYRGATLNITIKGTGHDVDKIELDGKAINGTFIAASELSGTHNIAIKMKDGPQTVQGVTITNQNMRVPAEPVVVWNGDSAHIYNYDRQLAYKLVIDGKITYTISDSTFAVPSNNTFSEMAVVAANKRCFSYTSRPFIVGGSKFKYYLIAPDQSDSDQITLHVNVPEGGDYMLSINYTSYEPSCDARIVTANTHKQGVTLLSGLNTDGIAGQSNLIHVDLLRNDNTITIAGLPTCHGKARPISVNLFKK